MKKSLLFSFSYIGQIGFATAIPLVIFAGLGRWLDNLYGTSPYLLLLGILVATIQIFFYLRKIVQVASEKVKDINE